jgi:hypothetical protein
MIFFSESANKSVSEQSKHTLDVVVAAQEVRIIFVNIVNHQF